MFKPLPLVLIILILAAPAVRAAEDDEMMMSPATKPAATSRPAIPAGGRILLFDRLRDNAGKLGLSDSQKDELAQIAQTAREKTRSAMLNSAGDREKTRLRTGEIMRDSFERVRAVLTPEQQRKMRDIMSADASAAPAMRDEMSEVSGQITEKTGPNVEKTEQSLPATPVDPATLQLKKLDGKPVTLTQLKGKPVVLIFGSHSCPALRQHIQALDNLARQNSIKAHFVLIYTKEAHPTGGWEVQRNRDLGLSFPPHKTESDRLAAAKQLRTQYALTMPIALDTMDDAAIRAFDAFPNGCVILDRTGQPAARQTWAEPKRLASLLAEVAETKPATKSAG